MARKPNYGFEKRQKEILRAKKNEEKAERKEAAKQELGADYIDPALFGGVLPGHLTDVAEESPAADSEQEKNRKDA
jgi:hypothetical protein